MKTIIKKAYRNYEKEEKWLNEMSAKGFALTDYSWCRYVFADIQPGEYIHRIELLEYQPSHPASQKYLRFMEENSVEHIASYMRWVYFRKKASDGPFDIYSDIDSKIKHYQRINLLWLILSCAELLIFLPNIIIGLNMSGNHNMDIFRFNLIGGLICFFLGVAYFVLGHPLRKKIQKLKKENLIIE